MLNSSPYEFITLSYQGKACLPYFWQSIRPRFPGLVLVDIELESRTAMSLNIAAQLGEISSLPSTGKASGYLSLLDSIYASTSSSPPAGSVDSLGKFIDTVAADSSLVVSKQVVAVFVKRLTGKESSSSSSSDVLNDEDRQSIAERTLELLSQRQASFEEQVREAAHSSSPC